MKILILGGGGREHALAWKIAQSPLCERLIVAPGNAGVAAIARTEPLKIEDGAAVVAFCRHEAIDFVVIGPEAPLAAGVADALTAAGIACFGPSQAAAQLESSKTFTKQVCAACGAPTAAWASFDTADAAKIHIMASGAPIVVKADGLAAGKGVVVAETVGRALAAVDDIFRHSDGARVVIEEAMLGEEASLFVLTDGDAVLALPGAQDHKRVFEGDKGPNTGGMGAFSPTPVLSPAVEQAAIDTIIRPVLREMRGRGTPYRGVLYAGLMIAPDASGTPKPRLVEFNARFGDPEAQALVRLLDSDLLPPLLACAEPIGAARAARPEPLATHRLDWSDDTAICVTIAARGYPGDYAKGEPIGGLAAAGGVPGVEVFHAGTRAERNQIVSNGGRVLSVTASAPTLAEARHRAGAAIAEIDWPGGFHRRDIGEKAAALEAETLKAAARAAPPPDAAEEEAAAPADDPRPAT